MAQSSSNSKRQQQIADRLVQVQRQREEREAERTRRLSAPDDGSMSSGSIVSHSLSDEDEALFQQMRHRPRRPTGASGSSGE